MGSATHSIGQLLCMNLLISVQFFSCLFLAIFINPTALSDLFQVLFLLFSPVTGTFIHEARVDAELCCFLKTDLRQQLATSKSKILIFSAPGPGRCVQNLAARFCTHLPDFARCKQDFAPTWNSAKQGETHLKQDFALHFCSKVVQLLVNRLNLPPSPSVQIQSASSKSSACSTWHPWIQRAHISSWSKEQNSFFKPCLFLASVLKGTRAETWQMRAVHGEKKTHLPPTLHRLKNS